METNEQDKKENFNIPIITHSHWKQNIIWLLPVIALLIGISLFIHSWVSSDQEIIIKFKTAEGLEAGKTEVKYKDVKVGIVKSLTLNNDGSNVLVTVVLDKNTDYLTREDTRFWVVRPHVGIRGITGIGTLISGAYIDVDQGNSEKISRHFTGLESPPTIISSTPGTIFNLVADDLGSLGIGSPVYYKRVQVGRISSYKLEANGDHVNVSVFIESPYDKIVTSDTRFWNVSGIDLSVGTNGFQLKTGTVESIMSGGIAFFTPKNTADTKSTLSPQTIYTIAKNEESAMSQQDGPPVFFNLVFNQSLHNLSIGDPVVFSSINVGRITSIALDYNKTGYRFPTVVGIEVFPNRIGKVIEKLPKTSNDINRSIALFTRDLVDHGLRAQVSTSSLLTGRLYILLDFVPHPEKVAFDMSATPLIIPTVNGGLDKLQEQLSSIIGKIDKMPLESIANNLNTTLGNVNKTLSQFNGTTLPEASNLMQEMNKAAHSTQQFLGEDSAFPLQLTQTLQELQRTMRSVRNVTDMLDKNPESLLKGRPDNNFNNRIGDGAHHQEGTQP